MTLDDLRARREDILALAERYGAYNVRVFGSVARGDATSDSDIDLLVATRSGVNVFDMVGLWLDLKEMLECEVSLITEGIEDKRFLQRIQADTIAL
ncbi:MAG: nucleotidyltransferase domain-containing protein [Anaerolineae bacterium]|nr:nucleotidyltransferase domain-containing protein [Anaerolineae bacterium]